ncbi:phosphatase PAP2 family protein [Candidatus Poribacteria bacterium]|nr:phosphatase PAP2 family protein [Candidatus Poribacteria bacterium]
MRDRGNITRLTVPFLLLLQIVWCYTASANWLRDADERMYHLIHDHRASPLDAVMPWVSRIGSGESEIVIAFILPIFGVRRDVSYTSIAATVGAETVTFLLKGLVNRRRPTGDTDRWNSSFPSGHATSAYAMAYVWGAAYPKVRLPLYVAAALIAYSRIYNGRHYPMDVLAGAGIGYLCGRLAWRYRDHLLPHSWREGGGNSPRRQVYRPYSLNRSADIPALPADGRRPALKYTVEKPLPLCRCAWHDR